MKENPILAPVILVLVYIVATVLFVPGLILTLGAGSAFYFAYGERVWASVLVGTLSVFIGAEIGSIFAFLLGRFVFRSAMEIKAQKYKTFIAIQEALKTDVSFLFYV